MRAKFYTKW